MDSNTPETTEERALWNPNAAAAWSVIFTPLFGAYIQALNWRALGNQERERASMQWVYAAVPVLLACLLFEVLVPKGNAGDTASQTIAFAFLVAWYFASGREQAKVVKDKFGDAYPRKPWKNALLFGLAGFGIYIGLTIAIGIVIGIRNNL